MTTYKHLQRTKEVSSDTPGRRGLLDNLRGSLRPLGLFTVSRIAVALVVLAVVRLDVGMSTSRFAGPWPNPPNAPRFFQALSSWDASWYLLIAQHGYFFSATKPPIAPQTQIAFFPLWPYTIRWVSAATGLSLAGTGVALAFIFGALASVGLWYLVKELCDDPTAYRSVALWVFLPGSLVLSMAYSEGLLVLCSSVCLLALLREKWAVAGLAAALATGTHPEGLALIACCAWSSLQAVGRHRQWRSLVAPLFSTLGVLAFFSYLDVRTGDFLRWFHVERRIWQSGNGLFHDTVYTMGRAITHPSDLQVLIPGLGILFTILGFVLMVRWRPPVIIWLYTVAIVVFSLGSDQVGIRPRVLLVAFPLTVAIARVLKQDLLAPLVGLFGAILATLTFLVLTLVVVSP